MRDAQARPAQPVVCHLIETLLTGGAEAEVTRLTLGLRELGYRPVVCCLTPGPLVERLRLGGVTVECLNLRRPSVLTGPRFVVFAWRAVFGLHRMLRRHRAALLHAHLPDSILWGVIVGRMLGIPVIGTYQGLGIMPARRSRIDPRGALRRAAYRWADRCCDRTIAVSAPIRRLLCDDFGFRPETTILIPNGTETAAFAGAADDGRLRTALGLRHSRVITCVGRLIESKGHRYLIQAMAAVLDRHPDARLLLAGGGAARSGLERLAHEAGVADSVLFLGDRDDVSAILALTEVFALATFSEGLPVSVIEAMAAGRPVVVTSIPGNLEVVPDERFGVLVPTADAAALAIAICGLLDDPERARALAHRGQIRVRDHFDVAQMVGATAALYLEVLPQMSQPESRPT